MDRYGIMLILNPGYYHFDAAVRNGNANYNSAVEIYQNNRLKARQ